MTKRDILLLGALAALGGCIGGSSPDPDYYALAAVPGPVTGDVTYIVKLLRPAIPGYLDRPEFVRQDSDYDVHIDDGNRWAEPLDTMLERVLMQDMQQRLPAAHLMAEDDDFMTEPRVTVAIAIQQFNRVAHGKTELAAQINLRDQGTHEQPPLQHVDYTVDSSDTVGDLSALLGKLADDLATALHDERVKGDKVTPQPPKPAFQD